LKLPQNPHVFANFWQGAESLVPATQKTTSARPKVLRTRQFFALLTWKYASRHSGVHFFDISTSKIGPNLMCFAHLSSKCASRHNGVQFVISYLAG